MRAVTTMKRKAFMKRHYGPDAAVYCRLKWYQLDTIKPTSAHRHDRESEM
jgi:hypothetical protein